MTERKTKIAGILLVTLIVIASAVYTLDVIVMKSLPQTDGTMHIAGLSSTVDVYRDKRGVPHVLASNEYDMYFTQGFVHAQDRLWQMDLMRRYGQGRLSEIVGSKALPADRLMRTLGMARRADSLYRSLSQQSRNILFAYTAGVNACIEKMKGKYPLEFDMLQYRPEPWKPEHSILIARLMGWELALSWWSDITLSDVVKTVGEVKARQAFPPSLDERPMLQAGGVATVGSSAGRGFQQAFLDARTLMHIDGSSIGSNGWVVTRSKSLTGLPLLANDTHLMLMQPTRWYLIHLSCPSLNVAGVSLPGTPSVVIGQNRNIAWGLTNLMADDVDFYYEHVNYRDSTYMYKGAIHQLQVRIDSIFVKDSLAVAFPVYETVHGPIINFITPRKAKAAWEVQDSTLSVRWTGFEKSDETRTFYNINHATTWSRFTAALQDFGTPAQNFLYADRSGNIGYAVGGIIPLRENDAAMMPSSGSSGANEWRGFIRSDQLPREYNPPEDMLATANNAVARSTPYFISHLWESESRITRIREMLNEETSFAAEDFRLMQMDVQSSNAGCIRDAFVHALLKLPHRNCELTRVLNLLAQWNLRMPPASVPAAIFNVAWRHLVEETFRDEMGDELFRNYVTISNIPARVMPRLLADTSTTWFDNVRTPRIESRDDILRKSVMLAMLELSRKFGPAIEKWKWGALHFVTLKHPLGSSKNTPRLFNIGPLVTGGNNTTVNNSEYSLNDPFEAVIGASMRMIVDLAAPDICYVVLAGGQSGQPLSPHYADQAVLWQSGGYHQLILAPNMIRRSKWPCLTLSP